METRWIIHKDVDKQIVDKLSDVLGIDKNLSTLLVQRGIENYDDAKEFFRPSLTHLHDPFLMKDMDKAVSRIKKAWENGEKILIYGDYDVDGTTAVALIYTYLKNFINKKKIEFYISIFIGCDRIIIFRVNYEQRRYFPLLLLAPLCKGSEAA